MAGSSAGSQGPGLARLAQRASGRCRQHCQHGQRNLNLGLSYDRPLIEADNTGLFFSRAVRFELEGDGLAGHLCRGSLAGRSPAQQLWGRACVAAAADERVDQGSSGGGHGRGERRWQREQVQLWGCNGCALPVVHSKCPARRVPRLVLANTWRACTCHDAKPPPSPSPLAPQACSPSRRRPCLPAWTLSTMSQRTRGRMLGWMPWCGRRLRRWGLEPGSATLARCSPTGTT